jgi:hypothetical protein
MTDDKLSMTNSQSFQSLKSNPRHNSTQESDKRADDIVAKIRVCQADELRPSSVCAAKARSISESRRSNRRAGGAGNGPVDIKISAAFVG